MGGPRKKPLDLVDNPNHVTLGLELGAPSKMSNLTDEISTTMY